MVRKARAIAFYLPQYHPVPENDEWWGQGFTEWTNTAKATPMFRGHYQPHIPADLGFYDLRVPETRAAQAEMAREYGIEAFCYYHYWFAGRQLLERPFQEVLESGEPNFPFCLCWANGSWTGVWHGLPHHTLIKQTYPGKVDDETHFDELSKAFKDERYVKVDGKPVFVIYHPQALPEPSKFTKFFRMMAAEKGLEDLYLVGVAHHQQWEPREHGFDAAVVQNLPGLKRVVPWRYPLLKWKAMRSGAKLTIYRHKEMINTFIPERTKQIAHHPCIIPNWDNSPRSGMNSLVLTESTPELFQFQLNRALDFTSDKPLEQRLIFVKSWNEWAEGNHLEPDLQTGLGYLEVLKAALSD